LDSTLWVWGFNGQGQLGTGDVIQKNVPINVGVNKKWIAVAAATGFVYNSSVYGLHSLAISNNQDVICSSGANYAGQLGNGSNINNKVFDCNTGLINIFNEVYRKQKQKIIVYPNPATDFIQFTINIKGSMPKNVRIFNASGRMIYSKKFSTNLFTYSVSDLSEGLYFVEIHSDKGEIFRERFLVLR
jgi:hypothetical protein